MREGLVARTSSVSENFCNFVFKIIINLKNAKVMVTFDWTYYDNNDLIRLK